mgnify:FL=1
MFALGTIVHHGPCNCAAQGVIGRITCRSDKEVNLEVLVGNGAYPTRLCGGVWVFEHASVPVPESEVVRLLLANE